MHLQFLTSYSILTTRNYTLLLNVRRFIHKASAGFVTKVIINSCLLTASHLVILKDHRTHIFEIKVTRFLKLILQKIDLAKLLSLKILRGFVLRR